MYSSQVRRNRRDAGNQDRKRRNFLRSFLLLFLRSFLRTFLHCLQNLFLTFVNLIFMENIILSKHQFFKNGAILLNDAIRNFDVRNDVKSYIKKT